MTPPTPNSATTTITAFPSQGTSASHAGDIGPKEVHLGMSLWEEGAGRTKGHHHHHLQHQREFKTKHSHQILTLSLAFLHCPMTQVTSLLHWQGFKSSHVGN